MMGWWRSLVVSAHAVSGFRHRDKATGGTRPSSPGLPSEIDPSSCLDEACSELIGQLIAQSCGNQSPMAHEPCDLAATLGRLVSEACDDFGAPPYQRVEAAVLTVYRRVFKNAFNPRLQPEIQGYMLRALSQMIKAPHVIADTGTNPRGQVLPFASRYWESKGKT